MVACKAWFSFRLCDVVGECDWRYLLQLFSFGFLFFVFRTKNEVIFGWNCVWKVHDPFHASVFPMARDGNPPPWLEKKKKRKKMINKKKKERKSSVKWELNFSLAWPGWQSKARWGRGAEGSGSTEWNPKKRCEGSMARWFLHQAIHPIRALET